MAEHLTSEQKLTIIIENHRDDLEPDELAATILDSGFVHLDNLVGDMFRWAAFEAEVTISSGDTAEFAAIPEGATGVGAAISARDGLHEDPHEWLRGLAKQFEGDDDDS